MSVPDINPNRLNVRSSTVSSLQGTLFTDPRQGFPKALFQAGLHANSSHFSSRSSSHSSSHSSRSTAPLENDRSFSTAKRGRSRTSSLDTPSPSSDRKSIQRNTLKDLTSDPTYTSRSSPIRDRQEGLDHDSSRTTSAIDDSIGQPNQSDESERSSGRTSEESSADITQQSADPADDAMLQIDDASLIQDDIGSENKKVTLSDLTHLDLAEDENRSQSKLPEIAIGPLPTEASNAVIAEVKPTQPQLSGQSPTTPVVKTGPTPGDGQVENPIEIQEASSSTDLAKQTDNATQLPELVSSSEVQASLTSNAQDHASVVQALRHNPSLDGSLPTTNTSHLGDGSNSLDASSSISGQQLEDQNTNPDSQSDAQHNGQDSSKNTSPRSVDRPMSLGLSTGFAVMNPSDLRHEGGQGSPQTISLSSASHSTTQTSSTTNTTAGVKADSPLTTTNDTVNNDTNVSRVIRGLRGVLNQNGGSVNIRLTPPQMGVVRVQMKIDQGIVTAQLQAEHESARSLLQHQLSQLRTALETHGLTVEKLEVQSLSQTSQSNLSNDANQSHSDQDRSRTADQSPTDGQSRGRFDQTGPSRDDPESDHDGHSHTTYSTSIDEALNLIA